ncbi:MAG: LAGLIDADG family homing endonuclease [Candidatus Woesearchaeota archaeon]
MLKLPRNILFFILKNGDIKQIRADRLKEKDLVAIPYSLHKNSQKIGLWKELLKNEDYILHGPEFTKKSVRTIKNRFGTLTNAHKSLKLKNTLCSLTAMLKRGFIPFDLINGLELNFSPSKIKLKERKTQKYLKFPKTLSKELAEFLGYLAGDGYINKKYVEIVNQDLEVLNRIQELSKNLFDLRSIKKKEKRRASLYNIRIVSKTLVTILNKLFGFPIGAKKERLKIPDLLLQTDKKILKAYIRAYMDCDGSVAVNQRTIEVTSRSEQHIRQLQTVLLYFGISSAISLKKIKSNYYTRLSLSGRSCEKYAKEFGSIIRYKNGRLKNQIKITELQGDGKKDMLDVGTLLFDLRESYGITINKIQEAVNSYGNYERHGLISRDSLKKVIERIKRLSRERSYCDFTEVLGKLANKHLDYYHIKKEFNFSNPYLNSLLGELKRRAYVVHNSPELSTTELGKKRLKELKKIHKEELLSALEKLSNSDLSWSNVARIEENKKNRWVYDFTVEKHHNFVANNVIVHNTTTAGKLAKFYKKRGYKIAVVQTDTWRPAAYDQLEQLAKQVGVDFYGVRNSKDPLKIYKEFQKKIGDYDLVIVDTAGRDALSDELIKELNNLNKLVKADERLLVISGDLGQAAQNQAEAFHDTCQVTGVVVTKLEGTAKGGGALSACAVTQAPIKFIGVGEKIDDLELFHPQRFVGRLIGMGDIETLLEKAQEAISEEDAKDLGEKFLKGDFNLLDLYQQMSSLKKMGSLKKIMEMIPGFSGMKLPKEMLEVQEGKLEQWKIAMSSMTRKELEDPETITAARIDRISKGSGISVAVIRELLKQHRQGKKMMKMFKGEQDINKMMKKMKGKMPKGLM